MNFLKNRALSFLSPCGSLTYTQYLEKLMSGLRGRYVPDRRRRRRGTGRQNQIQRALPQDRGPTMNDTTLQ